MNENTRHTKIFFNIDRLTENIFVGHSSKQRLGRGRHEQLLNLLKSEEECARAVLSDVEFLVKLVAGIESNHWVIVQAVVAKKHNTIRFQYLKYLFVGNILNFFFKSK